MNIQPNNNEQESFNLWYSEHKKTCYETNDKVVVKITASGIGNQFVAKCPICGAEQDITDYECW